MLLGLTATLAVVALGLGLLLWGLDRPFLKLRLQAMALAQAGLDIEYGATQVRPLSGLRIDGLVVRSPEPYRAAAPELLRVGALEVGWTLGSLLGRGPLLKKVAIRGVELTLVRDEDGRLSLPQPAGPQSGPPPPPEPPTPTSRILSKLLSKPPPLALLRVEQIALTLVLRQGGHRHQRLHLRWEAPLEVSAERAKPGWRLRLHAGSAQAPVPVVITVAPGERLPGGPGPEPATLRLPQSGRAALQLWLSAAASPGAAEVMADLKVVEQTLAPQLKLGHVLHLEAQARFTPIPGKTELTLTSTEVGDGAATVEADVELADGPGALPIVHRARGQVDLVRLLALAPAGLIPVRAREALLHYDIDQLTASPQQGRHQLLGRVSAGHLAIDGKLADLHAALSGGGLSVAHGRLEARLAPAADGAWSGSASIGFHGLDSAQRSAGPSSERDGTERVAAREGKLALKVHELRLDPAAPLATSGRVEVSGEIAALHVTRPGFGAEIEGLGCTLRTTLHGHAPYAFELNLPIAGLRVFGDGPRPLLEGPARLGLDVSDLFPDLAQPQRSRARALLDLELGGAVVKLTAQKQQAGVEYDLALDAASLAAARALVPQGLGVPWEQMALALRSKGRVDQMFSAGPTLDHKTDIRLDRPAYNHAGVAAAAQGVTLALRSSGTARRHDGEADLRVRALSTGGRAVGDGHLHLTLAADAGAPALHLKLGADAPEGPEVALTAALAFDRGQHALSYEIDARLGKLAALQPVLAPIRAARGFDLSTLALSAQGKGTLAGVIDRINPSGAPRLAQRPLETLAADADLKLQIDGLRWAVGEREVWASGVTWQGNLHSESARRTLRGDLQTGELHIAFGDHQLDFSRVRDNLDVTHTGLLTQGLGETVLSHDLTVGAIQQDFAPGYPLGDVDLSLKARRSADGRIRISALQLTNAVGGTVLKLRGGIDLDQERRGLALRGTVDQDLKKAWRVREDYTGQGALSLGLNVTSGDLAVFHAQALVKVADGTLALPRRGISIEAFDGEVPITADLILDRHGPRLLRDAAANTYSELRFADQHPLLDRRSYISVKRITTPLVTLAPLAGNLKIENNSISFSQFEAGLRGGRLTGQCLLDWDDKGTTAELRVRATGIQDSRGKRFDGNAAMVVGVRERSIEGRAEILRIDRRHLLDLLDLQDPHHADAGMNRIRSALSLGYPERVRLSFDHGFASLGITFGGLAHMVRIDELKGIPIGPIIDRALAGVRSPDDAETAGAPNTETPAP